MNNYTPGWKYERMYTKTNLFGCERMKDASFTWRRTLPEDVQWLREERMEWTRTAPGSKFLSATEIPWDVVPMDIRNADGCIDRADDPNAKKSRSLMGDTRLLYHPNQEERIIRMMTRADAKLPVKDYDNEA